MDPLEQTLITVAKSLGGRWHIEEQVKHSAILPILQQPDWNVFDSGDCVPEYPVDSGWVDYALMSRNGNRPLVFFEAKRRGGADASARAQLFRYGFDHGVPFLVLTDGAQWDFYLSMGHSPSDERWFYGLDLRLLDKVHEHAKFLERHLSRDRVRSGEAEEAAKEMHTVRRTIPDVFNELLRNPDEEFLGYLAKQVKKECGFEPKATDLEEYLKGVETRLKDTIASESSRTSKSRQSRKTGPRPVDPSPRGPEAPPAPAGSAAPPRPRGTRAEWRAEGRCVRCGAERDGPQLMCSACRERDRAYQAEWRARKKAGGGP